MIRKILFRLFGIVLVLASVGFAIWSYVDTRDYITTTGSVTAVEFDPTVIQEDEGVTKDHKVTIEYTVDGTKYETEVYAAENDYHVGDQEEVGYDPGNPNNTAVGRMSLPVLIAIVAVAVIVGIVLIFKA